MLIRCKLLSILTVAVVLLAPHVVSQELNNTLYSTITGGSVAFSGENVTFTCLVRGSNTMEWSSEQYIGTGGRSVEFISTDPAGTTRASGIAVAELISAAVDEIIISRLFVRIPQSTFSFASVQCHNINAGMTSLNTFQLAENDTSITCDRQSVCHGETLTCVCAIGNSQRLAWAIGGSRAEFTSSDPLMERRNLIGSSTYAILTDRYSRNGIEVTTSSLMVTVSVNDTALLIHCENLDRSTSNPAFIPVLQNCSDPSAGTTTPNGNEPAPSMSQSVGLTAGVAILAVGVIGLMILCVIVTILAFLKWKMAKDLSLKIAVKEGIITEKENMITMKNEEIEGLNEDKKALNAKIAEEEKKTKRLEREKKSLEKDNKKLKSDNEEMEKENNKLKSENEKMDTSGIELHSDISLGAVNGGGAGADSFPPFSSPIGDGDQSLSPPQPRGRGRPRGGGGGHNARGRKRS